MMRRTGRSGWPIVAVVSLSMILMSFGMPLASAKPEAYAEERTTEWKTDDLTQAVSVHAGDLDRDGDMEIVTGGLTAKVTQGEVYAQLRVWSADWCSFSLVQTEEWTSSGYEEDIKDVFVADVDTDANVEVVTVGYELTNLGAAFGKITTWQWASGALQEDDEDSYQYGTSDDTYFTSVIVRNVGGDSRPEIVVGGYTIDSSGDSWGLLAIYDGSSLGNPVDTHRWRHTLQQSTHDTVVRGVSAGDVDADINLDQEIVTAGIVKQQNKGRVDLTVFSFDGSDITEDASTIWHPSSTHDSANATSIDVNDVDGIAGMEIVVAGNAYDKDDDHELDGLLTVWTYSELGGLQRSDHHTWEGLGHHTSVEAVSVSNVDGDSGAEMITSGTAATVTNDLYANLKAWKWSSGAIVEDVSGKSNKYWRHEVSSFFYPTSALDLVLLDVDPDTAVEVVTSGSFTYQGTEWAELKIWTWNAPYIDDWTDLTKSGGPGSKSHHAMAYDESRGVSILFGGLGGTGYTDETWKFDHSTDSWTELSPTHKPDARGYLTMTTDCLNHRIVLFGGWEFPDTFFGDTWIFDIQQGDWTDLQLSEAPSDRAASAMVTDCSRNVAILFGGLPSNGVDKDDTWEFDFDAETWSERSPSRTPDGRNGHSMVYDAAHDRVLMFGGVKGTPSGQEKLNDLWEYDYDLDVWTDITPGSSPSSRAYHEITYDPWNDVVILFGGQGDGSPPLLRDTWVYDYDANSWTEMNPSHKPYKREGNSIVFDVNNGRAVLHGGHGLSPGIGKETWEYVYA